MGVRKIAVVGAGVVGMTTALQVQRSIDSVSVTLITETTSPNTTGDVSAGLWMPYLLQDTPQDLVTRWAKATLDLALKFWKDGLAQETGVTVIPVYRLNSQKEEDTPDWMKTTLGFSKLTDKNLNELSKLHKRNYKSGHIFCALTLEPSKFLPYLKNQFIEAGGKLEIRKITDLDSLFNEGYDVVVNCAGLGATQLVGDKNLKPIRGQICRVSAPWLKHIFVDESDDGNYIIPNMECVILGGTHQEGDFNLNVDEKDEHFILKGCAEMIPPLESAKILKHQVGLRPGRASVRLEAESRSFVNPNNGARVKRWIVHNYGHGGSGVTLCQGCAVDATSLVRNTLRATTIGSKL